MDIELLHMVYWVFGSFLVILLILCAAELMIDAHFRKKMNELDEAIHKEFDRRDKGEEPRPLPKHLTKNSIF